MTLFHQTPIPEPFPLLSSNLGRSLYQAFLCAMFPCLSVKYCLLFVMTKSTLFLRPCLCLSEHVFLSRQMSQPHDIFTLELIGQLKQYEAQFVLFFFLFKGSSAHIWY